MGTHAAPVGPTVRYRLVFDRIGRHPVAPMHVEVPAAADVDAREEAIGLAVHELVAERMPRADATVVVDIASHAGEVLTGARLAGRFSVEEVAAGDDPNREADTNG